MKFTSTPDNCRRPASKLFARVVIAAFVLAAALAVLYHPQVRAQTPQQRGVSVIPPNPSNGVVNGAYYALIIGINEYRPPLPTLKTAVNDAQAVARILNERYGFRVKLLLNGDATRSKIFDALDQYRSLQEDDNLLIYYGGHGTLDSAAETAYWQPVDTDSGSSNWISVDDLANKIRGIPARHILVISDSCYAGGMTREGGGGTRPADPNAYLRRMSAGRSRTLMASGGKEPVADSGAAGHSVFANAILDALGRMDAGVFTADDLFHTFIRQQVFGNSKQGPEYSHIRNSGDIGGDFVFTRAGAFAKMPAVPTHSGTAISESVSRPGSLSESNWEELKSSPSRIVALVKHGNVLVAADGSGQVYRSVDNGTQWTSHAIAAAVTTAGVTALASCGTYLLAGVSSAKTYDGPAIFASQDGVTWRPTSLNGNGVSALSCSGLTVLVCMWPKTEKSETVTPFGQRVAVFRAQNMTGDVVGNVVYPTLVVSGDGGNSWELSRKQFNAGSAAVIDKRLEVFGSPSVGFDINAREYCYNVNGWTCSWVRSKFSGGLPLVFQRLMDALYVGTRVGSVMVSANDGKTWKETPLPLPNETQADNRGLRTAGFPDQVTAMTVANHRIAAGTSGKGVYLSDESGGSWSLVGGRAIEGLYRLAYDGTFLYAGVRDGVLRTRLIEQPQ